jgi:hypothetical protein
VEHILTGFGAPEQQALIKRVIEADRAAMFDVGDTGTPPYRFHWFLTGTTCCEFFMSIHHAIDDGWGNQHFLGQLFESYKGIMAGERLVARPRPNVFKEFVVLEREVAAAAETTAFWRSLDIVPAQADRLTTNLPDRDCTVRYSTVTTPQLLKDLQTGCRRAAVSLRATVLAGYARALRKYMHSDVATIGVVCNGRSDRLSDPLHALGLFWNLVPVSIREQSLQRDSSEREVQQLLTQIEAFAICPLSQIARIYGVDQLFFATLNFTNFHNRFREDLGEKVHVAALHTHDRFHYPLNFHVGVHRRAGVLGINVEFDAKYFSADTVQELTALLIAQLEERAAVLMRT